MSPAGIPMFYASEDAATGGVRGSSCRPRQGGMATVARFELLHDVRIVDLADPSPAPSMFDAARRSQRQPLLYLKGLADDVSRAVTRDGAEHVEYVPTQIVTEHLRDALPAGPGPRLLGFRYRSSKSETPTASCGSRTTPTKMTPRQAT